ncbi:MAG: hypothetical protein E7Z74_00190 [Methanobrevibacter millerae]|uniref:Uncharacterized protein n=1 Tax=Methanobrevibacter millerae TaxID=230361 RepID=A0A8T3VMA8_9EURY|nr:hypothetical protein [Methanobrevibacter millerae]
MTSSFIIEKRENKLKKALADAKAENDAIKKEYESIRESSKRFFSEINRNADKLKLSDSQKKILFSIIVKL